MLFLRLIANVLFPAVAGFAVTLNLVLPLSMTWFPSLHPSAIAIIPVSGLVTALMCLGYYATRRLISRSAGQDDGAERIKVTA